MPPTQGLKETYELQSKMKTSSKSWFHQTSSGFKFELMNRHTNHDNDSSVFSSLTNPTCKTSLILSVFSLQELQFDLLPTDTLKLNMSVRWRAGEQTCTTPAVLHDSSKPSFNTGIVLRMLNSTQGGKTTPSVQQLKYQRVLAVIQIYLAPRPSHSGITRRRHRYVGGGFAESPNESLLAKVAPMAAKLLNHVTR